MDISIDGIIGSAKKINNQRNTESGKNNKNSDFSTKTDTIEISNRVDARLTLIQKDLKTIQESLTKNQVIEHGLDLLGKDRENQGTINDLYKNITFKDEKVLMDFLEDKNEISLDYFTEKSAFNERLLNEDLNRLAKLQIETENLLASNLIKDKKI